jgi:hypothetical protein
MLVMIVIIVMVMVMLMMMMMLIAVDMSQREDSFFFNSVLKITRQAQAKEPKS